MDDLVLFSDIPNELQTMIEELNTESSKVGLRMNKRRTKVMMNGRVQSEQIKMQDVVLEGVEDYAYLGQLVKSDASFEAEKKRRIGVGWSNFGRYSNILPGSSLLCLKRKVYNQCIIPVVTHGSETWTITKLMERNLVSAQRGMERFMLGVSLKDRKRAS